MQTAVQSWSTLSSLRPSTATHSMKVKTTSPIVNLTGRSRRNVAAITRGVSWTLATCTAISSDESMNTSSDSIEAASMARRARAPSSPYPKSAQPVARSTWRKRGASTSARAMLSIGTSQSAERVKVAIR